MPLDLPLVLTRDASAPRDIGAHVAIRAVAPDDATGLAAFFRELSPNSRTRRFHGGMGELPPELLAQFTRGDDEHGAALVAVTGYAGHEQIVGEARYAIEAPREAEFAIVVTDRMQGCGLGQRLLRSIVRTAVLRGVRRMYGDIQHDNRAMLALAASAGFRVRRGQVDPRLRRVELELQAPAAVAAVNGRA
jgi:acetyltransferase